MAMEFLPFPRGRIATPGAVSEAYLNKIGQPLLDAIRAETERCQVLVCAEFLNNALRRCLVSQISSVGITSKKRHEALLESDRSLLGTFSDRIEACRVFGLITEEEYAALTAIRKIRNRLAHADFAVTFSDQEVESHIQTIEKWLASVEQKARYQLQDGKSFPAWVVELERAGELKPGDTIASRHMFLGATIMLYIGLANLQWKIMPESYDGPISV